MANINEQIAKIQSSVYGDDIRDAIVSALLAINAASDYSEELLGIKKTLSALSDSLTEKADAKAIRGLIDEANKEELRSLKATLEDVENAVSRKMSETDFNTFKNDTNSNINGLKNDLVKGLEFKTDVTVFNTYKSEAREYVDDIKSDLSKEVLLKAAQKELNKLKEEIGAEVAELKDTVQKAIEQKTSQASDGMLRSSVKGVSDEVQFLEPFNTDGSGEMLRDTSYSDSEGATQLDVTQLRSYVNTQLSLKASQHDFDYIVGNGFQGWTITDYIIRIREDYNTALAAMASRGQMEAAMSNLIEQVNTILGNYIQISDHTVVIGEPSL